MHILATWYNLHKVLKRPCFNELALHVADTIDKLFGRAHTKRSERSRATMWWAVLVLPQTRKEDVAGPARWKSQEDFDETKTIGGGRLDVAKTFNSECV